ncbi:lytic transglycosylase domain-containing protein [Patulibacter americanus]|uniref:lytic transglycosylase domain-containing protein n=1 Tax=Patulibacter americanus TaxID=588672 RepID=UPI0003B32056|nr:lytic transglycosylase domain-containing protein [Patulibacter americanus]
MSVEAVQSRMAEIQALMQSAIGRPVPAAPAAAPAAATASSGGTGQDGSFASTLADAQATTRSTAPASASSATGSIKFPGPAGVPTGGSDPGQYGPMIQAAAQRHGIDPQVFENLVRQESGFNPKAGSHAGAQGLTQLMPATAKGLGVSDPFDPAQALEGGAKYLRQQLDTFGGDYTKALAAYNAGPGAVQRHGGVPPYAETQHYVKTILGSTGSAA